MTYLLLLKLMLLPQRWIKKKETDFYQRNSSGIRMMLLRFGLSDLRLQDLIFSLIKLKPSNIWMKSETQWKLLSNGLPRNQSWLKKTWEELDSTFAMLLFTLMLFTEVVDKSSPLLEESSMLPFLLLNQDSKNLYSCVKSRPLMMLWEVSINALPKEEVLLLEKSQLMELLLSLWNHICPSLNHSDSLNTWENLHQAEPSLNASSTIGNKSPLILMKLPLKPAFWLKQWERERDLNQVYPISKTSWISFERERPSSLIILYNYFLIHSD